MGLHQLERRLNRLGTFGWQNFRHRKRLLSQCKVVVVVKRLGALKCTQFLNRLTVSRSTIDIILF